MISRCTLAVLSCGLWAYPRSRPLYAACRGVLWLLTGREGRRSRTLYTTVHVNDRQSRAVKEAP
jgi:hypothetical protein